MNAIISGLNAARDHLRRQRLIPGPRRVAPRCSGARGSTVRPRGGQPTRKTRRGKGKSDPIDAHLAVLFAVGLDAEKLPTPAPTATAKPCASCCAHGRS
jgi:hypothetical protein